MVKCFNSLEYILYNRCTYNWSS